MPIPPPGLKLSIDYRALVKRLAELEPKTRRKIERQSLRPAMKVIAKRVRALAPSRTGKTRKAIKVRAGKRRRNSVSIELRIGKENLYRGDYFYAAFNEFDHRAGPRKLGSSRRLIPGIHFVQRGFESAGDEARNIALAGMWAGLEEAAAGR